MILYTGTHETVNNS